MISNKPIFLKSIYRARDQSYKSFRRRNSFQSKNIKRKKRVQMGEKEKSQKKAKIFSVQVMQFYTYVPIC